ncbi:MAG: orotidine 5'-phosphate decarboxylase [Candidatus Lokiarchaeota archaeon]|nr:orotidine 5'-phosphate decarboxylase [Candidatus Lokiarchaeota archaeon]
MDIPGESLKRKLSAAAYVRKTRLVIGLDLTPKLPLTSEAAWGTEKARLESEARKIIELTSDYAVAYKINRHLMLPLGLFDRIPSIIDTIHDQALIAIMDCKLNDIGNSNEMIANHYFDAGFDAIIANPLVGWDGGLKRVFEIAEKKKRGVITLSYMSHPAADEGYGLMVAKDEKKKNHEPLYLSFARKARQWGADGTIVGATYPEKIREIRQVLGDEMPILSPGVGAQGGDAKTAIESGASYVIVARSIVNADDPASVAESIASQTWTDSPPWVS